MIEYIKGAITDLKPTYTVIETNGIGYYININLTTYSTLTEQKECKIFIYEVIREDAHQLYGFLSQMERQLFLLLISVSGIGANTARVIMSSYSANEIKQIIALGDDKALSMVKGIGAKTAQRIIVDLKDKIVKLESENEEFGAALEFHTSTHHAKEESIAALSMLGYNAGISSKVVDKILKENANASVEEIIKKALKML